MKRYASGIGVWVVLLAAAAAGMLAAGEEELLTVAEKSGYKATSRYRDVRSFAEWLAASAPRVRLDSLGKTAEERDIPLLILADPPVQTPEEARRSGKLV